MEEMAISKFKATCLAVLERVRRTGRPVRVTRFGRPIAEIVPPSAFHQTAWFGSMRDRMTITGDIVAPATPADDWDALRE